MTSGRWMEPLLSNNIGFDQGTVTAVSADGGRINIVLNGVVFEGVPRLNSYANPAVDDQVFVYSGPRTMLIVGSITYSPYSELE